MLYSSHILEITNVGHTDYENENDRVFPLPENKGIKSAHITVSGYYKNISIKENSQSFYISIDLINEESYEKCKHISSDCGIFVADDGYYYSVQVLICSEKIKVKPIDFNCRKYGISPYLWSVIVGNLLFDDY